MDFTQFGFSQDSSDQVNEIFDFTRCQRSDGSYYGTRGKCRKGTEVEAKLAKLPVEKLQKLAQHPKLTPDQKKKVDAAIADKAGEITKPVAKKDETQDLQSQYSNLARKAQEAMVKGDMETALKLNKEAMALAEKMKASTEKNSPEAKQKEEKIKKIESDINKAKLPEGSKTFSDSEGTYIVNKVGPNEVKTLIIPKTDGSYEVGYKVNDSYEKGKITDRREQVRIALAAKRQFDSVLASLPEGTRMRAVAYDDDGGGDMRRKAYEKLGFKHQGNNIMTGTVSKGKVEGADFSETIPTNSNTWHEIIFGC
jgi:hypothetical protein